MSTATWRVRNEDSRDQGKAIRLERLSQGISDGVWGESDQALGPGDSHWRLIAEHPQLAEFVPRKALFRSKESEEAEMDMTPMIDVTFQLLIFFMIAATYLVQKTLDMPQPVLDEEGASAVTMEQLEKNNIMVRVDRNGGVTVQQQPASLNDLANVLARAIKQGSGAEVVLDVDDQVDHEIVVQVLDAAGAAQVEKVQFVSRVPSSPPTAEPEPAPPGT